MNFKYTALFESSPLAGHDMSVSHEHDGHGRTRT